MELAADLLKRGKASLIRLHLPVSEIVFLFSEIDFGIDFLDAGCCAHRNSCVGANGRVQPLCEAQRQKLAATLLSGERTKH
jgi:hypothetical protein